MPYEKKTANEKSEKRTMKDVTFEIRKLSDEQAERVTGGMEGMIVTHSDPSAGNDEGIKGRILRRL